MSEATAKRTYPSRWYLADRWLARYLADHGGRAEVAAVRSAAQLAGFSAGQLRGARTRLSIRSEMPHALGPWFWVQENA